jgi:hypothetical protein
MNGHALLFDIAGLASHIVHALGQRQSEIGRSLTLEIVTQLFCHRSADEGAA